MGDWGFKVAKAGFDVKTATNDQLAMTSALTSDKVVSRGTMVVQIVSPATQATTTLTHGLGYAPQFKIYDFTDSAYVPYIVGDTSGTFTGFDVFATSTTVVIRVTTNTGNSLNLAFEYQLLYNAI